MKDLLQLQAIAINKPKAALTGQKANWKEKVLWQHVEIKVI